MRLTDTLREEGPRSQGRPSGEQCPRCLERLSLLPSVEASALGGVRVRRCRRCGTRSTESSPSRLLFTCERCGLPFQAEALLPHTEQVCGDCAEGRPPGPLPEPHVVRATENEVRAALANRWRCVSSAPLAAYLDRLTRHVARRVEAAPGASRVLLVEEPSLRTLALPSGTLLVSLGMLSFLEDEAELVFVLAHELAHAASGDAAVRLVRLGFDAVVRRQDAPSPEAWAEAALDLVRLGYGRRRERDADARALEAILALDYDPESVLRFLRRLEAALESGERRFSDIAVSHPSPSDRLRRLERSLWGRVPEGRILRVNREVFRRAAGREALERNLTAVDLAAGAAPLPPAIDLPQGERAEAPRASMRFLFWAALTAIAAAAGAALLWFQLR